MARKTVLVSDMSGQEIAEGKGATVRITFRDALSLMQPWILLGGQSPRSLKRFVNHLRYLAMRFREDPEPVSPWGRLRQRLSTWLGEKPAEPAPSPTRHRLSEPLLVALS